MARYKYTRINGVLKGVHKVIWEKAHGPIPDGYEVHHKNGDGNDNRLENLLLLTKSEHIKLHHKLRREGTDPVDPNDPNVIKERTMARARYARHKDDEELRRRRHESYERNKSKIAETSKRYRETHKSEINAYMKDYRATHKEKIAESVKRYAETHKDQVAAMRKEYRETHKQELIEKYAVYCKTHKAEQAARLKRYYDENKEKILQQKREYLESHRDQINAAARLRRAIKRGAPQEVIDKFRNDLESIKKSHCQ